MPDLLSALLLGIIEGITEFLPISSTGHLLIAEHWLGARSDLFNIAIQAGAILAVVAIYWQRLWSLLLGLGEKNKRDYVLKLIVAFGVTGALGLVVKKLGFQLPEALAPIAWALLIGGFVILGVEAIDARRKDLADNDPDAIGWGTAVLVGLAQVLAGVFPGTSRSAAAIFAALLFGRSSRVAATEFAFLVGIPTMFAATGYELLHTLKDGGAAGEDWSALGVAFVVSAITAFIAVKWLLRYIQTHRFTVFAWYRVVLGAALLAWLAITPGGGFAHAPAVGKSVAGITATSTAVATARVDQGTLEAAGIIKAARALPALAKDPSYGLPMDAESIAIRKEFAHRKLCMQGLSIRFAMSHDDSDKVADFLKRSDITQEWKKMEIARETRRLDLADSYDSDCQDVAAALMDGSSYALALKAAAHGDRDAARCFVGGAFPVPPAMQKDPVAMANYRSEARRLMTQGIAAGDWNMVNLAFFANSPRLSTNLGKPVFEAPLYVPSFTLATTLAPPGGDAAFAYRMVRLQQLADPAKASEWEAVGKDTSRSLSPAQRSDADAWARTMVYLRYRNLPKPRQDDFDPCAFS